MTGTTCRSSGGRLAGSGSACAIGLAALIYCGACAEPKTEAWLGLNTHLGHPDYDGRWPSAKTTERDREIYFGLLQELQVPMIRDLYMCWGRMQPAPNAELDFSLTDDLVRRAQAAKIDVLALCWGVPRWAASERGEGSIDLGLPAREHTDAFKAFVQRFVERYDGDGRHDMSGLRRPIKSYEFMNEVEALPSADYAFWLKTFYQTVKEADPEAVVAVAGLRSPGIKIADQELGDYHLYFGRLLAEPELAGPTYPCFDAVSFHNYPASYPGRTEFDEALAYLRLTMAERQLTLPIWLTEYGYNSGANQEARQAENVVKWAVRARALGIERVYLHCLWDYHWPGEPDVGQNLGLLREVPSGQEPPKKPAFRAFGILLEEAKDRPRAVLQRDGEYKLMGSADPVFVVWKEASYDPTLALLQGWWRIRTLSGKVVTRQGPSIKLTEAPMFLERTESPFMN